MKKILLSILITIFFQFNLYAGESGEENSAQVKENQVKENTKSTEQKIVKDEKKEILEIDIDKITDALKEKIGPGEESKQNLAKKIDPFSKDLNTTREERKNLNKDSLYPVASFKLVATILSGDLNNMALIQLPGLNKDQVIVSEGQKIGRDQGIIKEISDTTMLVEENRKILKLTIDD